MHNGSLGTDAMLKQRYAKLGTRFLPCLCAHRLANLMPELKLLLDSVAEVVFLTGYSIPLALPGAGGGNFAKNVIQGKNGPKNYL